jgi:hypothetical protein
MLIATSEHYNLFLELFYSERVSHYQFLIEKLIKTVIMLDVAQLETLRDSALKDVETNAKK